MRQFTGHIILAVAILLASVILYAGMDKLARNLIIAGGVPKKVEISSTPNRGPLRVEIDKDSEMAFRMIAPPETPATRQAPEATQRYTRPENAQPSVSLAIVRAYSEPAPGREHRQFEGRDLYLDHQVLLDNDDIESTELTADHRGKPAIGVYLTRDAGRRFGDITESHLHKPLAILLDNQLIAAPVVQARIENKCQITGNFTPHQAQRIAKALVGLMQEE